MQWSDINIRWHSLENNTYRVLLTLKSTIPLKKLQYKNHEVALVSLFLVLWIRLPVGYMMCKVVNVSCHDCVVGALRSFIFFLFPIFLFSYFSFFLSLWRHQKRWNLVDVKKRARIVGSKWWDNFISVSFTVLFVLFNQPLSCVWIRVETCLLSHLPLRKRCVRCLKF